MSVRRHWPDDEYAFYTDANGKRHAILRGGRVVCDFCLAPDPPAWTYPAGEVRIVGHQVITHSDDPWGACDDCHALIEAGDVAGLVERMAEQQPRHAPPGAIYPPLPLMRRLLRANVRAFMAARTGPAERDLYPPDA